MATVTEVERLVYTIAEAAKLLSLSRGSAYQLAREGKIPTLRLGKRLVVPKAALLKMLAEAGKQLVSEGSDDRQ